MSSFRKALITGASSGIGRGLAIRLAQEGIALILTGRCAERLEETRKRVGDRVEVFTFLADLAKEEGRKELKKQIWQHRPDLMINNAGFGTYGEALSYQTKTSIEMVEVNCVAVLEGTLEAARALLSEDRTGTIINIASAAVMSSLPYFSVYAATKSFVLSVSEGLDSELSPRGIRVLCSCPGRVRSAFHRHALPKGQRKQDLFGMMTLEYGVERIWNQIRKGKRRDVFDWKYRLLMALIQILPQSFVHRMTIKRMQKMAGSRDLILKQEKF